MTTLSEYFYFERLLTNAKKITKKKDYISTFEFPKVTSELMPAD